MPSRSKSPDRFFIFLLICFWLSGATSLALEVVWVRLLTQVFGSTTLAISTVLATFMAGLALGSWIGGRVADKLRRDPLWAYAICEAGVGLTALVIPFAVQSYPEANAWLWSKLGQSPLGLAAVRSVLCAVLLLPPTTFMGATLPILSRAAVLSVRDFDRLGGRVAALYAVNTAGAVTGAVGAGLWLLPRLGLSALHNLAVFVALGVAGLGALLARARRVTPDWRTIPATPAKPDRNVVVSRVDARLVLAVFAVTGAVAMSLEVLFSRALGLILGSATQSFAIVLGMFLLGLSLGAALVGRFASRTPDPLGWLGVACTGAALAILYTFLRLDDLPELYLRLARQSSAPGGLSSYSIRAIVAATIAPVTFFLGAIMPLAVRAYVRSTGSVGRDVGQVYAANTIGAVVGSLAGGFVVLPVAGLGSGLLSCALVLAVVAAVMSARSVRPRLRWANTIVVALLIPTLWLVPRGDVKLLGGGVYGAVHMGWNKVKGLIDERELLFYRDGIASTVTVFRAPSGTISLRTNGKADGSTGADQKTQIMLGMLPALLHEGAEAQAFVIGYGTGMTVGALTQAPNVTRVDVAEIEASVYDAADRHFSPYTHAPEANPKVHRHVDDGRNFLRARAGRYDIIVSEPPNPWMAGVASLFTREFYESAKEHLAPGGVFCQWVPLYELRPATLKMIYRTFQGSFPQVLVFTLGADSILIGTVEPMRIDLARLEARMADPTVSAELARTDLRSPAGLLAQLAFAPSELAKYAGPGEVNTDDNGILEFAAQHDFYFAVSSSAHGTELGREVTQALRPSGGLETLVIDLGQGPDRARRAEEIARELERLGRSAEARAWRQRALEATVSG